MFPNLLVLLVLFQDLTVCPLSLRVDNLHLYLHPLLPLLVLVLLSPEQDSLVLLLQVHPTPESHFNSLVVVA